MVALFDSRAADNTTITLLRAELLDEADECLGLVDASCCGL